MQNTLTAETSVTIAASAAAVWKALTTPALIKQYLMGTHVTSEWKEGAAITYTGEYQGKEYYDKGVIKKMVPGKLFQSTYWSSMGGKEDKPENYNTVTYTLAESGGDTLVTLTQDNVLSEKEKEHVTANWAMVLGRN